MIEPTRSGSRHLLRGSALLDRTLPTLSPANNYEGDGDQESHHGDDLGLGQAYRHLELSVIPSAEEYQESSDRVSRQES